MRPSEELERRGRILAALLSTTNKCSLPSSPLPRAFRHQQHSPSPDRLRRPCSCAVARDEKSTRMGEKERERERVDGFSFVGLIFSSFFFCFVFFLTKKKKNHLDSLRLPSSTTLSLSLFLPNHEITQHPTEAFFDSCLPEAPLPPPPSPPSPLTHEDLPPTDTGGGGLLVGETSAAGVLAAQDLPRNGLT